MSPRSDLGGAHTNHYISNMFQTAANSAGEPVQRLEEAVATLVRVALGRQIKERQGRVDQAEPRRFLVSLDVASDSYTAAARECPTSVAAVPEIEPRPGTLEEVGAADEAGYLVVGADDFDELPHPADRNARSCANRVERRGPAGPRPCHIVSRQLRTLRAEYGRRPEARHGDQPERFARPRAKTRRSVRHWSVIAGPRQPPTSGCPVREGAAPSTRDCGDRRAALG
jgi:hypothetical protein